MRLDYSIPQFHFSIGAFDCTDYLDEFAIALPIHEITQPLLWSGRFKISFNKTARQRSLTEADFDQSLNPGRWRPGQAPVSMNIKGYPLPVLRIERYAYNPQTKTGEGNLVQIPQLLATDRPEKEISTGGAIADGAPLNPAYYSVGYAVDRLVEIAFVGCTVQPQRQLGSQSGGIWGKIASRNPINDAQRLLGTQWRWLVVDQDEVIKSVTGDPLTQPIVFTRTLGQLEWEPDIDHINFDAESVIVTGSHQQPAKIPCQDEPVPINPTLDRKGRIKVQKTTEYQPFSKVFARNSGGDLSPTISAQKWIFYNYVDDQNWDSQLWQFIPGNLLFEIQNDRPTADAPAEGVAQTVTVEEWPAGRIFSKLGTNTSLAVAVLELQSETRKARYVPAGVLNSKLGQNFTLTEERKEKLITKPYFPSISNHAGNIDPKTGKAKCLEPLPQPEKRQELAEVPLETVVVKGTARVAPAGWNPILKRDHVVEVGFLPDQGAANYLAQQIAQREAWRRDSVQVTMPIPTEWLVAGCPPLGRCTLHDGTWQMSGLIISMVDQEAKFAFTAARIDRAGVPVVKTLVEVAPKIMLFAEIDTKPLPLPYRSIYEVFISTLAVQTGISTDSGGGGGNAE